MVLARPGFNVIATANTRDQGVNELSAALKRRFNYVYIPIVGDQKTEMKIVQQRSAELLERYNLPAKLSPPVIELLATVFREIRDGKTADGVSLKKPTHDALDRRGDRRGPRRRAARPVLRRRRGRARRTSPATWSARS